MLSRNTNIEIADISPQILAAAGYMIKECERRGIPLQIVDLWGDKLKHITGDD